MHGTEGQRRRRHEQACTCRGWGGGRALESVRRAASLSLQSSMHQHGGGSNRMNGLKSILSRTVLRSSVLSVNPQFLLSLAGFRMEEMGWKAAGRWRRGGRLAKACVHHPHNPQEREVGGTRSQIPHAAWQGAQRRDLKHLGWDACVARRARLQG